MTGGNKEPPKAGDQMVEEITDPDGNVMFRAVYELEQGPQAAKLRRAATDEPSLRAVKKEEVWLDKEFEEIQEKEPAEGPVTRGAAAGAAKVGVDAAKVGLEIAKFGWEFIKDNKPVVDLQIASTSILSAEDKNGLHYYGAKQGRTGAYQYRVYNWPFEKWTAVDIKVELAGTYYAKPPAGVPAGFYLPSVYFNVPVCTVYWPYSASASAVVMSPANIGTPNNVNPMCEVVAKINVRSVIESFNRTFKFKAVGANGFSGQ